METATVELPTTRWELSAPESFVLLDGPDASGEQAFKLAVFELVGTGLLRVVDVEKPGILGQTRHTSVLVRGQGGEEPRQGPLASVWTLLQRIPQVSFPDGTIGVPVEDLVAAAHEQYGSLDGFVKSEVLPELERRGLYAREAYRILWLFPSTRWRLTPAGQQAREELQRLIALGDERFRGWVQDNPSQAMTYAALLGAAWFLMPGLWSYGYGGYGGADTSLGGVYSNFDPGTFESLSTSFDAAGATPAGGDGGVGDDGGSGGDDGGFGGDGGGGSDGGGGGC
jgi:uncharacterized membrane protein YgcG